MGGEDRGCCRVMGRTSMQRLEGNESASTCYTGRAASKPCTPNRDSD
jgi:hypothetical protein